MRHDAVILHRTHHVIDGIGVTPAAECSIEARQAAQAGAAQARSLGQFQRYCTTCTRSTVGWQLALASGTKIQRGRLAGRTAQRTTRRQQHAERDLGAVTHAPEAALEM